MPTYEYACSACAHEWELEQSIKDDAIKECPSCHEQTAKRQISRGTGFILKGGGWYADLYSSSGGPKKVSGTDAAASDSKAPSTSTESTSSTTSTTPSTSTGGSGGTSGSSTPAPSAA